MTQERLDDYEAGIRYVLGRDTGEDDSAAKTAVLILVAVQRVTAGAGLDRRAVQRIADATLDAAHRATAREFRRVVVAAAPNN